MVREEDRERMTAGGLSEADIGAVQDHLAMLRVNDLVPTKHYILRGMIEGVAATPTAMNLAVAQGPIFGDEAGAGPVRPALRWCEDRG